MWSPTGRRDLVVQGTSECVVCFQHTGRQEIHPKSQDLSPPPPPTHPSPPPPPPPLPPPPTARNGWRLLGRGNLEVVFKATPSCCECLVCARRHSEADYLKPRWGMQAAQWYVRTGELLDTEASLVVLLTGGSSGCCDISASDHSLS